MNRNLMNHLTAMMACAIPISFEADGGAPAGGGGSPAGGGMAVAAPPAGGSSAPAPVGGSTKGGGGFFRGLKESPVRQPEPEVKPDPAAAPKTDNAAPAAPVVDESRPIQVMSDDGNSVLASFDTEAEAEAYVKAEEAKKANPNPNPELAKPAVNADPEATPLFRPVMGRFKTIREVEDYIRQSGEHAQRIDADLKKTRAELQKANETREAELESLRAELKVAKETPGFKELTQEEFAALKKDDPVAATEYLLKKDKRDKALEQSKAEAERTLHERQETDRRNNEEIDAIYRRMETETKEYPMYRELQPAMTKIFGVTGGDKSPLRGKPWAPELLHLAALGNVYKDLIAQGIDVKALADDKAKLAAKAGAAAAAAPAGGGGGGSAAAQPKVDPKVAEHQAWRQRIRNAGSRNFLDKTFK